MVFRNLLAFWWKDPDPYSDPKKHRSESRRPKNLWIRIPNTGFSHIFVEWQLFWATQGSEMNSGDFITCGYLFFNSFIWIYILQLSNLWIYWLVVETKWLIVFSCFHLATLWYHSRFILPRFYLFYFIFYMFHTLLNKIILLLLWMILTQ